MPGDLGLLEAQPGQRQIGVADRADDLARFRAGDDQGIDRLGPILDGDRAVLRQMALEPLAVVVPRRGGGDEDEQVLGFAGDRHLGHDPSPVVGEIDQADAPDLRQRAGHQPAQPFIGTFALHLEAREPGQIEHAATVALDLTRSDVIEPIELVLRHAPSIRGRVVDPMGLPVKGARIRAVPTGEMEFPSAHDCGRAERDGALLGGCGRSDTSGEFQLGALVPGKYDFYADLESAGSPGRERIEELRADGFGSELTAWDPSLTPPARVATLEIDDTTTDVALVYAAHRLEATVAHRDGSPVELFGLDAHGGVDTQHLRVLSLEPDGWDTDVFGPSIVGTTLVYPLSPGTDYTAVWNDAFHGLIERNIETSAGGPWLSTLDLRLDPPTGAARVVVRLFGPEGSELPPKVHIRTAESRCEIECEWSRALGGGWSTELSPGRFVLEATTEPSFECVLPNPLPRAECTPSERTVELHAGERQVVEFHLERAGYLDLESISPPSGGGQAGEALCQQEDGYYDCERDEVRLALGGGFARLTRKTGETVGPLLFETDIDILGLPWIVPGWSARCSAPIPPGEWTFEVHAGEQALFQRTITVRPGEATVVRW